MSVNLQKGQKVSLSKEAQQAHRILVGLGWDANKRGIFGGSTFDIDASCFALRNGRLCSDKDICYFGHKEVMRGAIYHHGDNLTGEGEGDDEQITVNLDQVDSGVDRIVFVVNIYGAKMKRQSFGDVKNAFIRLVDENTGMELFRYNLSDGSVKNVAGLIFAELYRHDGDWKFSAIGKGTKESSVGALAKLYE